ncbi:MAG TPA: cupredoxin domain-containing protein [Gaiellaceae bacterium]
MRSFVLIAVGTLALVLGGAARPAATATKAVNITATAFKPASVTIKAGDIVKWTNKDTTNHQVVANNGAFASGAITANHSYSHTFNTAGTYKYHDALHPALTGKVVVTGPPPAVTIGAALPIIDYGKSTSIAGQVSSGQANEKVDVYAQPYGAPSAQLVASLLTGTGGAWAVTVKPSWATTYTAHWKSLVSATISVGVRPTIAFTINRHKLAAVKVKAATSHAGRKVYIQRFTKFKEWVKFRGVTLNARSGSVFRLHLQRGGRYTLRAYMTINQAGTGYLDGYSRTIVYRAR